MVESKRARGLSALLSSTVQAAPVPVTPTPNTPESQPSETQTGVSSLPITSIERNEGQPRTDFKEEALNELAASIKAQGVIQPVVVRTIPSADTTKETKYQLIAGERRWRAAQIAQLTDIPAIIKDDLSDEDAFIVSLIENLQRDNLNPIEEAVAFQNLMKTHNLTQEEVADAVGKSRPYITNSLRLLDLQDHLRQAVATGNLSVGHAKVLLGVEDLSIRSRLASKVQMEKWSVRQLEGFLAEDKVVQIQKSSSKTKRKISRITPPHIQEIEARLRDYFGTNVHVEEGKRKGKIVIEFYSVDDFDGITRKMGLYNEDL